MTVALMAWFDDAGGALIDGLSARLLASNTAVFRTVGEPTTRDVVARLIGALRADAPAGSDGALRGALADAVDELAPKGLGFHDLRLLAGALRHVVLASVEANAALDGDARRRIEDWLYASALFGAMYFVAHRERVFQEQATELEVQPLERQISELQSAYAEKTRLLDLLREVSTPIVPIHAGILLVPLIGVLDPTRAEELNEKLLRAITDSRARVVILDVSGVPLFDTGTAEHLIRTANATRLLGSDVVLVGLSPAIAQTVISLDIDLGRLNVRRNLQDGVAYALGKIGYAITPLAPLPRGVRPGGSPRSGAT